MVHLRQGDVPRAIPVLERAIGLCQDWHILLLLPLLTANLGLAYALDGRIDTGLALVEQGVEHLVAGGRPRGLVPVVACLSEAYLLAGRLDEARQRAAQALDLARQYQQRGNQAWALWLLGESTARQASPEVRARRRPLPPGSRPGRGAGHAPAPGALPPRPGHAYARQGQQEQARAALATAIALYRDMEMALWLPETQAALVQTGGGGVSGSVVD